MAPTPEYLHTITQTLHQQGVPEGLIPTVLSHVGDSLPVARTLGKEVNRWAARHPDPTPTNLRYSIYEVTGWTDGDPEPDAWDVERELNNLFGRGGEDTFLPRVDVVFPDQSPLSSE